MLIHGKQSTDEVNPVLIDANGNIGIIPNVNYKIYDLSGLSFIAASNQANNNTVILRTVTAGKTFYMTSIFIQCAANPANGGSGYMRVRDTSDVVQYEWKFYIPVTSNPAIALPFNPPLKVPAGYDVVVYTDNASTFAIGTITGYEV